MFRPLSQHGPKTVQARSNNSLRVAGAARRALQAPRVEVLGHIGSDDQVCHSTTDATACNSVLVSSSTALQRVMLPARRPPSEGASTPLRSQRKPTPKGEGESPALRGASEEHRRPRARSGLQAPGGPALSTRELKTPPHSVDALGRSRERRAHAAHPPRRLAQCLPQRWRSTSTQSNHAHTAFPPLLRSPCFSPSLPPFLFGGRTPPKSSLGGSVGFGWSSCTKSLGAPTPRVYSPGEANERQVSGADGGG